jgi:hypothetical protein
MTSLFSRKPTQSIGNSKIAEMNYSIKFKVTDKGFENVELNDGTGFRKPLFVSEPVTTPEQDKPAENENNMGFFAVDTEPSIPQNIPGPTTKIPLIRNKKSSYGTM